ncbi:16S rRNA (uracil(1498)-N(3))-methyltransferase [cf. Phormidesmis sp. LEGE 11477]|uniref:16S rRNA (uracil(1498)-N(3))-methyltransferase n=1 Tax=cf. Phormidesmis sp. LEGE 11477 TaxID=1828680 RepID=UPI00187E5B18|nr:16S rRNA (uracil(1498)-N(3))-methyltransferase [cf. Phormidesmis sp. LEGE 11477]MBE9061743.1 16S rRNA (uracil(1498)-N(3))-methyltransferase [cf. Phormidesmis sp. LEGE 11477]
MVQRITIDANQLRENCLLLGSDQTHYLRRVLRLGAGDRFVAQDGKGKQWLAVLSDQIGQAHIVETISPTARSSYGPLRLAAALPKGNSFDQVVRQATELGVTHIYPLLSDRTLLKPSPSRLTRWHRIAHEASEQSERAIAPEIFSPANFQQFVVQSNWQGMRYICATRQNSSHLLSRIQLDLVSADPPDVTLLIGPEGGWTSAEITVATENGYKIVSLGSGILRAVTASVTALSLVAAARELLV